MQHVDGIAGDVNETFEQVIKNNGGIITVGSICTGFGTAEICCHRFNDHQKCCLGEDAAQAGPHPNSIKAFFKAL